MADDDAREFVLIGEHAENLASGAMIGPGDRVSESDLDLVADDEGHTGQDKWLVDEGRLRDVASFGDDAVLEGDALMQRARDLDVKGRSQMSADDLRAAVAEREAELAEQTPAGPTGEVA